MDITIIFIIVWLVCAVLCYLAIRLGFYLDDDIYRRGYRRKNILFSILLGPIGLLVMIFALLYMVFNKDFDNDNDPAGW